MLEYRQVVRNVYPEYHGINVEMIGKVVFVRHSLLTGYEFSVGPLKPAVREWAATRNDELAKAGITAAGIMTGTGLSLLPFSRL